MAREIWFKDGQKTQTIHRRKAMILKIHTFRQVASIVAVFLHLSMGGLRHDSIQSGFAYSK